jgi:hypothetical protein
LCFSASLLAQDFEIITDQEVVATGELSADIRVPIKIKNISDKPIYIFVDRVEKVVGSTQTTNFCWGEECFGIAIERLPLSKRIEPGEISEAFTSVLHSGLVEGYSTVKYHIYTRSNKQEVVSHEVTYSIEGNQNSQALYVSDQLVFNEIYPNPVRDYAIINYQVNDPETEAKVILHNVLGSVVGTYDLLVLERLLKIETKSFNPGVYFYTLFIDGDGILTKKLIIRE